MLKTDLFENSCDVIVELGAPGGDGRVVDLGQGGVVAACLPRLVQQLFPYLVAGECSPSLGLGLLLLLSAAQQLR